MFRRGYIFQTFFAVVKGISVFVMAFEPFRRSGDEPVHELNTFSALVAIVSKSIPATAAQLRLPEIMMDLYPPPRVNDGDFAVG